MSASFVGRLSLNNTRKPLTAAAVGGVYQSKRPPVYRSSTVAAQISSAANDHVVVINEEDDEQQQNVFHVDNANGKHGKPCLSGSGGSWLRNGGKEVYLLIVALVLMTAWLVVLTVFVVHTSPSPPPPQAAGAAGGGGGGVVPILDRLRDLSRDPSHFKFPFTLQPDENTNGRLQTIQITSPDNFTVDQILSYDVCCMQASFYVCRNLPGIKNIGVDAYFDVINKRLVVQVIHADMVGAKCNLLWNVK